MASMPCEITDMASPTDRAVGNVLVVVVVVAIFLFFFVELLLGNFVGLVQAKQANVITIRMRENANGGAFGTRQFLESSRCLL